MRAILLQMKVLLFLLLIGVVAPQAQAHVVNQMVAEIMLSEEQWSLEVKFDAGYAIPETRGDTEEEAPTQEWLASLSVDQHSALRHAAVQYLGEWFQIDWTGNSDLEIEISFPEWETEPPEFKRDFGDAGVAYFRVKYSGMIPKEKGILELVPLDGGFPDLALIVHTQDGGEAVATLPKERGFELWEVEEQIAQEISAEPKVKGQVRISTGWQSFVVYGFEHVLPKGLDHVLFLLGLFFLSTNWRHLVEQSLLFTIGHTCTLFAVITLDLVVPGRWVEPLIAITILWIGAENLWVKKIGLTRRIVVFCMGLIHGLGYASVLRGYFENVDSPLIGVLLANVGIELAQLFILSIAGLLFWWARDRKWYNILRISASSLVAFSGLIWFLQRIWS